MTSKLFTSKLHLCDNVSGTHRRTIAAAGADFIVIEIPNVDCGSCNVGTLANFHDQLMYIARTHQDIPIVLDLSDVKRSGAAFLGILARVANAAAQNRGRLLVCGDGLDLLRITGLDQVIRVFPTRQAAIRSLDPNRHAVLVADQVKGNQLGAVTTINA